MDANTRQFQSRGQTMNIEQPSRFTDAVRALKTEPCKIADPFALGILLTWSVDPQKVEKLLESRGQRVRDGESIREAVERFYGADAAQAVELAIDLGARE